MEAVERMRHEAETLQPGAVADPQAVIGRLLCNIRELCEDVREYREAAKGQLRLLEHARRHL